MEIFKNKFLIIGLLIIISLFFLQVILVNSNFNRNTDSYLFIISGNGTIQRDGERLFLSIDERKQILDGDLISIIGENSLGIIEWGDNSVTRLSGNSRLRIDESNISNDLNNIKISFELLKGKTWSNVLSIMGQDSYFHQTSKEVTASVRGTTYEFDVDNEYLRVIDHKVDLENSDGEIVSAYEGDVVGFRGLIFDELLRVRDEVWESINKNLDEEHIQNVRNDLKLALTTGNPITGIINYIRGLFDLEYKIDNLLINGRFDRVEDLLIKYSGDKKELILSRLKMYNQKLNFEAGDDKNIYNRKLAVRNLLIEYGDNEDLSETLTTYAMYDLGNMFSSDKIDSEILESTLLFLESHKNNLNIDSDLQKSFGKNADLFNEIFNTGNIDFSIDGIINNLESLKQSGQDLINRGLDSILNFTNN